jgi:hypothetical protein
MAPTKNQNKINKGNLKSMMAFLEVNAGVYGSLAFIPSDHAKDDVNDCKRRVLNFASPSSPDKKK